MNEAKDVKVIKKAELLEVRKVREAIESLRATVPQPTVDFLSELFEKLAEKVRQL